MFTGIIAGLGKILSCQSFPHERRFGIQPLIPMKNIEKDESIAINGVCLSVESFSEKAFVVYASKETLARTTLGMLHQQCSVNLERALKVGDRIGGHLVSGHIDCVAEVANVRREGESLEVKVRFPGEFATQIVSKGSVALDGISLTVNDCGSDWLMVNVIPLSQQMTNIGSWKTGTLLNLETDIIGKYVSRGLECWEKAPARVATPMDRNFLLENGFF